MLKLTKTTGVIESVLLSTALIMPMVLFMKYDYFTLFYVYICFFILFGIMCQIFQTTPGFTSFIVNSVKSGIELRKENGQHEKPKTQRHTVRK